MRLICLAMTSAYREQWLFKFRGQSGWELGSSPFSTSAKPTKTRLIWEFGKSKLTHIQLATILFDFFDGSVPVAERWNVGTLGKRTRDFKRKWLIFSTGIKLIERFSHFTAHSVNKGGICEISGKNLKQS